MQPDQAEVKDLAQLTREMNPKQLRNSLKRAYRAEAKKVLGIARKSLHATRLQVKGSKSDWDKGIRSHIYSRGGGFMITVKAHRANLKGQGEKSMHENRKGFKKPVLMWAEEGTKERQRGGKKIRIKHGIYGTHRSGKTQYWTETKRKDGIPTGRMGAYGFLERATPEMFQTVEHDLGTEVGVAVEKVAKKCGFV
jgi:hypothetical protein